MDKIQDIFAPTFAGIVKAANNERGFGIASGIKTLDECIVGFRKGDLITLGGRTGMGKTAFSLVLINNIAINDNTPTLLFFLEGKSSSVVEKLLSIRTLISLDSIRSGRMEKQERDSLSRQKNAIKNAPLYIETNPYINIDKICDLSRKAKEEQGIQFIVIDYLQLIYGAEMNPQNRYLELNYITRRLKSLAKELDLPILVVSQMNREVEKRNSSFNNSSRLCDNIVPRLCDMRDSGTICEDSDIVLLLARPECYRIYEDEKGNDLRGLAYLEIAKSRYSESSCIELRCALSWSIFEEIEEFYKRIESKYNFPT